MVARGQTCEKPSGADPAKYAVGLLLLNTASMVNVTSFPRLVQKMWPYLYVPPLLTAATQDVNFETQA